MHSVKTVSLEGGTLPDEVDIGLAVKSQSFNKHI